MDSTHLKVGQTKKEKTLTKAEVHAVITRTIDGLFDSHTSEYWHACGNEIISESTSEAVVRIGGIDVHGFVFVQSQYVNVVHLDYRAVVHLDCPRRRYLGEGQTCSPHPT